MSRVILGGVLVGVVWLRVEVEAGWIDPDTHPSAHTISSHSDNSDYKLVFSDEFNVEGRDFKDGNDPRWTAIHKNDYTNFALHYYSKELAKTSNGFLNITTLVDPISFKYTDVVGDKEVEGKKVKTYQSGMVQGWNKFCFTGGIVEISARYVYSFLLFMHRGIMLALITAHC